MRRQAEIYVRGASGAKPLVPTDPRALELAAREALSPEAFAYIAGGAGSESTIDANRAAFERRRIVPRVLRDVASRRQSVELFGRRVPAPIFLAPIGVLELAHRDADLAVARAAAASGIPMVFSNQASVAMETCAAAMATRRGGSSSTGARATSSNAAARHTGGDRRAAATAPREDPARGRAALHRDVLARHSHGPTCAGSASARSCRSS